MKGTGTVRQGFFDSVPIVPDILSEDLRGFKWRRTRYGIGAGNGFYGAGLL